MFNQSIKNLFLPSPENNFYPASLRPQALLFYILIAVLIKLASLSWVAGLPKTDIFATISSRAILSLTNEEREVRGLALLAENTVLTQAAYEKALDMVEKKYFAHTSPEGKTPWYWFQRTGYNFRFAGENLAIDFFESEDVVRAWLDSDSHRANLLNEHYREMGIAVLHGDIEGRNTSVVVQLFGTPKTHPLSISTSGPLQATPLLPGQEESPMPKVPSPLPIASFATSPEPTIERVAGMGSAGTPQRGPLAFQYADELLTAIADPRWFYYLMIGYMIFAFALGTAHHTAARPEIAAGTVLVLMVVAGMLYLPDAQTMFGLQARVTP